MKKSAKKKKPFASESKKSKRQTHVVQARTELKGLRQVGKIDLDPIPKSEDEFKVEKNTETPKAESTKTEESFAEPVANPTPEKLTEQTQDEPEKTETAETEKVTTQYKKLTGLKIAGDKIDLKKFEKKEIESSSDTNDRKRRRKRITKNTSSAGGQQNKPKPKQKNQPTQEEPSDEEIQKQIRETLEKLQGKTTKSKGAKYRREKRDPHRQKSEEDAAQVEADSKLLKVTEFVTVGEIATMMDISSTNIISACMTLGIMVTMNQRLDAETLSIVAEEFGYTVEL